MERVVVTLAAFLGALALTPLARAAAFRWAIVDRPGDLKTQRVPVAYLGGVAVFLAAAVGPIVAGEPWLLIPGGLALALGLADDIRPLPVSVRISAEVTIAGVAAAGIAGPALTRVATAVLVLGLLNAVNLLDGQDGLASGTVAVIAVGFALLGGAATTVGLALAGALCGFLVFNRPPARIYLGDAGAYFLGTMCALLPSLTEHAASRWSVWWAVPLLVAVPVVDTAVAILRRLRAHQPLLVGDRSHVYDQLVDRGFTVGRSTAIGITAQVIASALGLLAARSHPGIALAIVVTTAGVVAVAILRAGFLRPDGVADH